MSSTQWTLLARSAGYDQQDWRDLNESVEVQQMPFRTDSETPRKRRVLVTDGQYTHTLGIARSLGRAGIEVGVIAPTPTAPALHSRFCRWGFVSPPLTRETAYLAFLENILSEVSFDLIIPVGASATRFVSRHRDRLASKVRFQVADQHSIETAFNKRNTYALAQQLGIPYPRTLYPQSMAEVEQLSLELGFPVVVKAIVEEGTNVVHYPRSREQLLQMYEPLCTERGYAPPRLPMLQEFVHSDDIGYSFAALYKHGRCKRIFMYREIRSIPVRGGSSTYAESFFDEELKQHGMRLLDALNWTGVAQMDFRRGADGGLRLMEINPKFWASLELALAAGLNFPQLLCEMATGQDLSYSEEYVHGVRYHWPLSRELLHVAGRPSSLPAVLWACLDPRIKSNVWVRDPKPNLIELAKTLAVFLRQLPGLGKLLG